MELKAKMPEGCKKSVIVASIRERLMMKEFRDARNDFEITHVSKVEGNESWDAIYTSGGTKNIAEIKVRDKTLSSWDHEGWIIEEYKYNKLKEKQAQAKAKGNDCNIIYINIFRDATVVWNLDHTEVNFFNRDSKVMTTEAAGRKIKSVAYLKSESGTVYSEKLTSPGEMIKRSDDTFYFLFPGENK